MRIAWAPFAAVLSLSTAVASGPGAARAVAAALAARVAVPSGSFYAGQLIPLQVIVTGSEDEPSVEWPNIPNVEFFPAEAPPKGGLAAPSGSADGAARRLEFRVVSRRQGTLVIPPLVVRSGGQTARTSGTTRLTIRPIPTRGRGPAFLGGVGTLDLEALAEPTTVTVGRTIDYEIRLRGSAALGTSPPRGLLGFEDGELAVRAEMKPAEASPNPESRIFRWSLRPTKPGSGVIPPQPIAFFDPLSSRFQTKWTRAIPITVKDVARFDPSSLSYAGPAVEGAWFPNHAWAVLAGLGATLVGSWFAVRAWRRRASNPTRHDPGRVAVELARRFSGAGEGVDAVDLARQIGDSLSEYLNVARGRPRGALTPAEARQEVEAVVAGPECGAQAASLIERCDWVCYSGVDAERGRIDPGEARRLADAACELFLDLSRSGTGPVAESGLNGRGEGLPPA